MNIVINRGINENTCDRCQGSGHVVIFIPFIQSDMRVRTDPMTIVCPVCNGSGNKNKPNNSNFIIQS
jgi:DnaJ-class molecular chaperone